MRSVNHMRLSSPTLHDFGHRKTSTVNIVENIAVASLVTRSMQRHQHLLRRTTTKPNSIHINVGISQAIPSHISFNTISPTTIHLIFFLIPMLVKYSLTTIRGAAEPVVVTKYMDVVTVVLDVAELDA